MNDVERIEQIADELMAYQPIIDIPFERFYDIALALVTLGYVPKSKTEHIEKCLDEIDRLKTAYAKQKAEIERLTEENARFVNEIGGKDGWRDTVKGLTIEKFELQEQVDECNRDCEKYAIDNGELLQQVNWLKDDLELQKALYNRAREDGYCTGYKSAVKDTAKEIANWLPTTVNDDKNVLSRIIREHYGVEVE